jgi:hypothetical protein
MMGAMRTRWVLALALLCVAAAPAAAKTYTAERYDVRIQIEEGGAVRVTETIVLHFQDGTFSEFFREIPLRRTDGIEILAASLDGRPLEWGDGVGQAEITGRSRRRVRWRFAEAEGTRHMFMLTYRMRGAIRRGAEADVLAWRALPGQHSYTIVSSTIAVETSVPLVGDPDIRTRRVGFTSIVPGERGLIVSAQDIRRNGYVELLLAYPQGALIAAPPGWQLRRQQANALAPTWAAVAAGLFLIGLAPFLALAMRYDGALPDDAASPGSVRHRPDALPPPVAGALVSAGQTGTAHGMATLFDLADRGEVTIAQVRQGGRGKRKFEVRRSDRAGPQSNVERAVLDVVFTSKEGPEPRVELAAAARRLARRPAPVRDAMRQALAHEGLWHDDRARVRRQHFVAGTVLLIVGGLAVIPAAVVVDRYLAWSFLPAGALLLAGAIGLAIGSSRMPLSNEGVRRAARWSGYRQHLKDVAKGKAQLESTDASRLLATAVALGLASDWARYLKTRAVHIPDWFQGWSADDGDAALAAMIGAVSASTAGSSSGGGAGSGAAAGGGASGAS